MTHEMIAANKVGAGDRGANKSGLVETNALPTDAGHEFSGCVFAQFGGVESVKIVKQGTCRLKISVEDPRRSPGQFPAHSKVAFQKKISTEDRVSPTAQAYRVVISGGTGGRGRDHCACSDCCVELLRTNCTVAKERQNQHRDQAEPFQNTLR